MKKRLTGNFTLKILSVFVAAFIWILVINLEDPVKRVLISNVPVQILNEVYLESDGMMPMVESGNNVISVYITGKRSVVDTITAEDIEAVADLTQIVSMDTTPVMVPVTVSCPGISAENIEIHPRNMEIQIENIARVESVVAVSTEGTPGTGYEIGTLTSDPEKVLIRGPESIVSTIDKVVAQIDVAGITESRDIETRLKIYDKDGKELAEEAMGYLKFDIEGPDVAVHVELWKTMEDVPFNVSYIGMPASGYEVDAIKTTPETITIAGNDEALQEFTDSGGTIEIPEEEISVENQTEDFEVTVDISNYLPENVVLATDVSPSIVVKVKIKPLDSKEFDISTLDIKLENKSDDLTAAFELDKISVRIRGSEEDLNSLVVSDISASLDLTGLSEGEHELPVTIRISKEGFEIVDTVTVKLELKKRVETTSE